MLLTLTAGPLCPAASADAMICKGATRFFDCEETDGAVGPGSPGVLAGTEYVAAMECGPRRVAFDDAVHAADAGCRDYIKWCPLAPGAAIDETKQIVVYRVYATTTRAYLRLEIGCDVGLGPTAPTMAQTRDTVTRHAPPPLTLTGGTDYLLHAAVVFTATGPAGTPLTDIAIHRIPLAGHTLTARLHLTRTTWNWGDGTTDTYTATTTGTLTGHPYTDTTPCETVSVCTHYIAHPYTTTGPRTITVTAYWSATVTLDTATTTIPVTGGVHRPDPTGKTITIHQARSILVGNS